MAYLVGLSTGVHLMSVLDNCSCCNGNFLQKVFR
ncbi:MAG: DUF2723 domain-containing protein [Ignavibacteriales bacterium]|nr:DUF2723 domain-containing protein [Ignavibacteriales bacterium]